MRIIVKILLAPLVLALTLITLFARFITRLSGVLLDIVAVVLGVLGAFTIFMDGFRESVSLFVFAFLSSPMGLPLFADWLINRLDSLNYVLKTL